MAKSRKRLAARALTLDDLRGYINPATGACRVILRVRMYVYGEWIISDMIFTGLAQDNQDVLVKLERACRQKAFGPADDIASGHFVLWVLGMEKKIAIENYVTDRAEELRGYVGARHDDCGREEK